MYVLQSSPSKIIHDMKKHATRSIKSFIAPNKETLFVEAVVIIISNTSAMIPTDIRPVYDRFIVA